MSRHYLKLVRNALRSLRHPHLTRWAWWRTLTKPIAQRELWIPTRDSVANGAAIGVFFSMLILMPFQMVPAALIAIRAKANLPFALACCWLSNPVTFGPLLWLQCKVGKWMRLDLGVPMPQFLTRDLLTVPEVGTVNAANFLLGMMTFSVVGAMLVYPIVHLFSAILPHHLPVRRHKGHRWLDKELPGQASQDTEA